MAKIQMIGRVKKRHNSNGACVTRFTTEEQDVGAIGACRAEDIVITAVF